MTDADTLAEFYGEALSCFPYPDLNSTSIIQGSFEPDETGMIEYAEEFECTAGKLFDQTLIGGGWIELRREAGEPVSITAFFGVSRDGDWQEG